MRRPASRDRDPEGLAGFEQEGTLIEQLFRNIRNQRAGRTFEQTFLWRAKAEGLLVIENGQKVRWLTGGKVIAEKCQLDFTVLTSDTRAAFLDCKAVKGDSMPYSAFDPRQLRLAAQYESWGFVAGFVVYFRQVDRVSFFSAGDVAAIGARKSAKPHGPGDLGPLATFCLSQVFTSTLS